MNLTNSLLEQIEMYLKGELKGEELKKFSEELKNNDSLANEVKEFSEIFSILDKRAKKKALRVKLDTYHEEIESENSIFSLKYYQKRKESIFQYIKIAGVAAIVALVSTFAFLNITGLTIKYRHNEKYNELKKDIASISKKQNSIWKEIFASDKSNEKAYSGTCFAITKDGYLLTSFHLVNGLDSVSVTQNLDSTITYKADIIAVDTKLDLALLKIEDSKFTGFTNIPFTLSSDIAELGDEIYTIGYSKKDIVFGEGSLRSVTGFNSDTIAYEISIPAQPGNSGAPLINSKGNLIGVVNGRDENNSGSAYAIKSVYINEFIQKIESDNDTIDIELPYVNGLKNLKKTSQVKKLQPIVLRLETF